MIRAIACLLVLCLLLALAGCKSSTKTSASVAALQVIETIPATDDIRASEIYPEDSRDRRFTIVEAGEITFRSSPTTEHSATIALAEGDERIAYLKTDDDGHITMTAVLEADDNAISLFDPPLVIAFDRMSPGREYVSESRMRVVDAKNPRTQKESGKAKRTITYIDDQRIRIPAGEFVARRLTIRFEADLKLADAFETTTIWVDPQSGIIARQSEEQVKVLGLGGGKHTRTIVAIE